MKSKNLKNQPAKVLANLSLKLGKMSADSACCYIYHQPNEYSCAVTPQVRQTGNRLSGLAGTAYASLLA